LASGCAARINLAAVPFSPPASKALACQPELARGLIAAGDDYEVLATVPAARAAAFGAAAALAGVAVSEIGSIGAGAGLSIEDGDGRPVALERTGWDHFA